MKITIVGAGKIKEKYLTTGIGEFVKRLTPYCRLQIVEVAEEKMPENPSPAEKEKVLIAEGQKILRYVPAESYVMVLDVGGKSYSSEELAERFDKLALMGKSHITFVIGGAFGISEQVLAQGHERISFSRMTFTHQMIRLLLVEQIYRAFKISKGEPYHW